MKNCKTPMLNWCCPMKKPGRKKNHQGSQEHQKLLGSRPSTLGSRALNFFYKYLSSMDGVLRPQEASKENMRQVGCLQFDGNHLLPESMQRKLHTLWACIMALCLFYKFLLAQWMYLTNQQILPLSSNDVDMICSAQELT